MPRLDHAAFETDDPRATAAFYEWILGARVVEAEGHPVMAYVGNTGFAFHERGGPGDPRRRSRLGSRAGGDQAPPRRGRDRERGTRPRDRGRPLLRGSRRPASRGDHVPVEKI